MRKLLQHFLLQATLVLASGAAYAQNVITGRVIDAQTGDPLIGASVIVKTDKQGVITDADGKFSLSTKKEFPLTLHLDFVGYRGLDVDVYDNSEPIEIQLQENYRFTDEVVVIGYGKQKQLDLTGAVTSVKIDEALGDRPIVSVSEALLGAAPGLLVTNNGNQAGTSKSFQIRGAYSLGIQNADGSYGATIAPLILIDNVEGDIDLLNPEDIESVSVLKDAASTAIYGARAAGGVILITTKHPNKQAKFTLNYNNNFAFSSAVNLPQVADGRTYLNAYKEAEGDTFWTLDPPSVNTWLKYLDEYERNPGAFNTIGDGIYRGEDGALYYLNETDHIKNILETSFQQSHNVSVSGATDRIRYRVSAGYVTNDGILILDKDKYTRENLSAYVSSDVTKWFTQEATLSYSHSKKTAPESTLGGNNFYSLRFYTLYPSGIVPEGFLGAEGLLFFTPENQLHWSTTSKALNDNPRLSLRSTLKPIKNLDVILEYTFDRKNYDYHWYTGSNQYSTVQGGVLTTPTLDYLQKIKKYTNYNALNVYATYQWNPSEDHHLKLMAGFNQESNYTEQVTVYSYGQAVIEVPALSSGTSSISASDNYIDYTVRGGFFRLNYDYKERYLLEVNGRYDGSSKFPKNHRYGFFPSISAGWNIANERFFRDAKWLELLKLRASYGQIGNQNIPAYAFVPTMNISNKYNNWITDGAYVTAVTTLPALVSDNFTWEKVSTIDLGIDFSLLKSRLSGTFDWYRKDTKGMLAPGMQLPAVVGSDAPFQNTADLRTNGWELTVNWRDHVGKDFSYRIGFNLSTSESKITKYDSNESKLLSSFYKGQKLGEIWGYVYDSFYTVDDFKDTQSWQLKDGVADLDGYNPRPGDVKFKNLRDDEYGTNLITSGNNTLDNPGDRKVVGNSLPRYVYGINLGATYKGFDLSVFIQGTGKRDAWINNNLTFPQASRFLAFFKGTEKYWRPVDAAAGDYTAALSDAEFPRLYDHYGNTDSNYRVSDHYLQDASYLRVKNLTLSYSFPKRLISNWTLSQLKAFLSIENLATLSNLPSGIDPETLSWNYPLARTISFGINVSL